jgi:hypothetical protein
MRRRDRVLSELCQRNALEKRLRILTMPWFCRFMFGYLGHGCIDGLQSTLTAIKLFMLKFSGSAGVEAVIK